MALALIAALRKPGDFQVQAPLQPNPANRASGSRVKPCTMSEIAIAAAASGGIRK